MKNNKFKFIKITFFLGLIFLATISCEKSLSDDFEISTHNPSGEIYTDAPEGLTDAFFISFDPASGANTEGFGTDENEAYKGTSSIRIDVPTPTDPNGGYIGGIFKDRGAGRDLTGYDALTFWAKGSTTATVNTFGFGSDFEDGKYGVLLENVELSTDWRQIIIPIPDPSKLVQEKGMFLFATGTQSTNGVGFTFWMDEIRFEKLETIAQPRPKIIGGQDQTAQANIDTSILLLGLTQTFNLANGQDVTVLTSPSYFDFVTSNPFVASVNDQGVVTVDGPGEVDPETGQIDNTATITASIGGVEAAGSLTIEATDLNVISVFSDVFANVPVDTNYNGFWEPWQTTLGGAVNEGGNNIIDYTMFNFVAIEFYGRDGSGALPIDTTEMTHLHIDARVNETVDASDIIDLTLFNNITLDTELTGTYTISGADLTSNDWVQFDIPLSSFNGLIERDAVGGIMLSSNVNDIPTIANVSFDNIYFYSEN